MKYRFQSASNIQDYLEAIAGSDEFIIKRNEAEGIIVINYVFTTSTTFPDPMLLTGEAQRLAVLRRDCRGIKFDLETGDVVTKPYHKFFNVNQLPETQSHVIDWSHPHVILEKLDGSMVTSFKRPQEAWQWHTKMGATEVAKPISKAVGETYSQFCEAMREEGLTAIFEWLSRQQRIVIDYPTDQLILTAIRHNVSGEYVLFTKMRDMAAAFGVPVVRAVPGSAENIQRFLDETAGIEDAEGFVIRFDDGHMCKVKGLWYCHIHNTKDTLRFEKNVWSLLLNDMMDDARSFMDDKDRRMVEDFSGEFDQRLRAKALSLCAIVQQAKPGHDKKSFAIAVAPTLPKEDRSMAFRIWDGHDPLSVVRQYLSGHVGTQTQVDSIRYILDDLNWKDYYYGTPDEDC
jgi:RNA ligase